MEPFEKAFDQLRREYLAEAGTRIAELRADIDGFRAGVTGALASLRTRFHRLVGSGGSYGFPEVSSAAREAERWLSTEPGPAPADADFLDDAVDRLAVLFSEAETALRSDLPRAGEARVAVLSATEDAQADELREALANAGFAVRVVPERSHPVDVAGSDNAQLVVLTEGGESAYATAAAWAEGPLGPGRAVILVETGPVDRLRAAVAGVETVFPAQRAVTDLARFAQRFVRVSGRRYVVVVADQDALRAGMVAEALGHLRVEVRRAGTAQETADHLDSDVPDLIVAAANLPGGGGGALARMLRQDARCAGVPIVLMGELAGAETVAALRDGADEVIARLGNPAELAPVLRARAERGRRLRELVRRDPLTGLLNNAAFVAELEHAVSRAQIEGKPLALMLVKLEHFRRINERHGHATGDRVLAHAASVVRGTVRASDPAGRYGARTFAVVLRAATLGSAAAIAAKLDAAFAEHPYETRDGGTIPLRARIGSAAWRDDAATAEELLHAADRRLGKDVADA